jgi:drug/metabolite transporter (DMT)-like permease
VAISVAALLLVLGHVAAFGIVHEADEGTPARAFQFLMATQTPFMAYFALTWLKRARASAFRVLAVQAAAALAAIVSVSCLT